MGIIFLLLGIACIVGGFVCSIIILIAAFQDEIWKGIVCLICGPYSLYYALFEFDHEKKALIVAGALLGSILGAILISLGGVALPGIPVPTRAELNLLR